MTSWSDSSRATGARATQEAIDGLEVVPRKVISYRDRQFEEMDTDAILARHPQRALVDELAHTNVPGSRHVKRWQDVDELLDAGIDVITTVNIQHLESLNDVVERITGARQRETVPDDIVRAADQIEVVDITPEALRRRMVHGNIYGPDKVDAAARPTTSRSGTWRRCGNWRCCGSRTRSTPPSRSTGPATASPTRGRPASASSSGSPSHPTTRTSSAVRRGSRSDSTASSLASTSAAARGSSTSRAIASRRTVSSSRIWAAEYHDVVGDDVASALVDFALAENATQLVIGSSRRSRWTELVRGSVINRVIRRAGPVNVQVMSHEAARGRPDGFRNRQAPGGLTIWRSALTSAMTARATRVCPNPRTVPMSDGASTCLSRSPRGWNHQRSPTASKWEPARSLRGVRDLKSQADGVSA